MPSLLLPCITTTMADPKGKQIHHKKYFEIQEQVFLESMKNLVKGQLHLMSEIATIQDQVVTIIHNHDELQQWGRTGGLQHVFSPHFFKLSKETQAFFCLFLFLLFQILLQLLFHGHFKHLTAHLPGFLQTLLK